MVESNTQSYRLVALVEQPLNALTKQLNAQVMQLRKQQTNLQFKAVNLGCYKANMQQSNVIMTWAQRLLSNIQSFALVVYGISVQPPGKLFLKCMPQVGQIGIDNAMEQLNAYLQQYQLPTINVQNQYRIEASQQSLALNGFEYLDCFRTLDMYTLLEISSMQLQMFDMDKMEWLPQMNIFLRNNMELENSIKTYQYSVA